MLNFCWVYFGLETGAVKLFPMSKLDCDTSGSTAGPHVGPVRRVFDIPGLNMWTAFEKCDGTREETRFRLSVKRTSPFKSAGGRQFSRLLAAEVCASAVVMLDTPCSEVV